MKCIIQGPDLIFYYQWVETNPSNIRFFPKDIHIYLASWYYANGLWMSVYGCSRMLEGLVSSHPYHWALVEHSLYLTLTPATKDKRYALAVRAFLKPVPSKHHNNVNRTVRLQLYKPQKLPQRPQEEPTVWFWWPSNKTFFSSVLATRTVGLFNVCEECKELYGIFHFGVHGLYSQQWHQWIWGQIGQFLTMASIF
jgi:hypothetical protein